MVLQGSVQSAIPALKKKCRQKTPLEEKRRVSRQKATKDDGEFVGVLKVGVRVVNEC